MLENLITSKARRKLLALFLMNPAQKFYLREICRRTGEQPNAVKRELEKFLVIGLIAGERSANSILYSVNRRCSIYPELHHLIVKTEGIGSALGAELAKFPEIRFAFIFGSVARAGERPKSDIDVMVVGKITPLQLVRAIRKLEKKIGREISYLIYPEPEFLQKLDSGFLKDVMRGKKVMLVGDEHELERFAEKRPNPQG